MDVLRSLGGLALLLMPLSPAASAFSPVTQGKAPQSLTPESGNLDSWADFIRPSGDELSYEKIGWRSSFWPAIEEARGLGRPVLLWTMNGHPLGCT